MCATCGCGDSGAFTLVDPSDGIVRRSAMHRANDHGHATEFRRGASHDRPHPGVSEHRHGTTIALEQAVLAKNDLGALRNRGWLRAQRVLAINLVSAPGAGKTTLLERTLTDLRAQMSISVIEGDQETYRDAQRIRATGCKAVQINTGAGCHLDAQMVADGLAALAPPADSTVIIENVGNLVCPALFDLGEAARVVVLSVTEGDDKPLKYPQMFRSAQLLLLNKIDLLPYVRFSLDTAIEFVRRVNPAIGVLPVSATTGEGMPEWYRWLAARAGMQLHREQPA